MCTPSQRREGRTIEELDLTQNVSGIVICESPKTPKLACPTNATHEDPTRSRFLHQPRPASVWPLYCKWSLKQELSNGTYIEQFADMCILMSFEIFYGYNLVLRASIVFSCTVNLTISICTCADSPNLRYQFASICARFRARSFNASRGKDFDKSCCSPNVRI